jgi:hypothetical protein
MSKQTSNKFSPEVRSRAVRLVLDHEHERAVGIHAQPCPEVSRPVRPQRAVSSLKLGHRSHFFHVGRR